MSEERTPYSQGDTMLSNGNSNHAISPTDNNNNESGTNNVSNHRRIMAAVTDRDRKIAIMGAELGMMRGKMKESAKRCEDAERLCNTHQTEENTLRQEVDKLKAKLQGLSAVLDRTTASLGLKEEEVVAERKKRQAAEAVAEDLRHQMNLDKVASRVEISRLQEAPKKTSHETQVTHRQLSEQENVITVLRRENFRLLQMLKDHGINPNSNDPPEYAKLLTQQRSRDVPSLKKYRCSPMRDRTPSPSNAAALRGPSADAVTASKTVATLRSRSRSPGPMSIQQTQPRIITNYKVGARVMWKAHQGIVRYVGDLHFAEGQWVGVELSTKNGDHSGTVDGVRYFACPPKTGVFCRMWELAEARAPTMEELSADAISAMSQPTPPPATVAELRDFQKMYENL